MGDKAVIREINSDDKAAGWMPQGHKYFENCFNVTVGVRL